MTKWTKLVLLGMLAVLFLSCAPQMAFAEEAQVRISCAPSHPQPGDTVVLTAQTSGLEGMELAYQWMVSVGGEWTEIPGATGNTYRFVYEESLGSYSWRVQVKDMSPAPSETPMPEEEMAEEEPMPEEEMAEETPLIAETAQPTHGLEEEQEASAETAKPENEPEPTPASAHEENGDTKPEVDSEPQAQEAQVTSKPEPDPEPSPAPAQDHKEEEEAKPEPAHSEPEAQVESPPQAQEAGVTSIPENEIPLGVAGGVALFPVLADQPSPKHGELVTLTPAVSPEQMKDALYQWYVDTQDGNGFTAIPGQTLPTFCYRFDEALSGYQWKVHLMTP